jgi:hypothetical protein
MGRLRSLLSSWRKLALKRTSLLLLLVQSPTKVFYSLLVCLSLALAIFPLADELVLDQLQLRLHDADPNRRRRKVSFICSDSRFCTSREGFQNGNVVLFGERPPKLRYFDPIMTVCQLPMRQTPILTHTMDQALA